MREEDIRPADLFARYLELCREDAFRYFHEAEREILPCPACGCPESLPAFEKWGFHYVLCKACETLYQSPRPLWNYFERFYQESASALYWADHFFPSVAEARRIHLFRPKVMEVAGLCAKDGFTPLSVADIGAGYGIFLEEWKRIHREAYVVAVEPNPVLAELCRGKGFDVIESFLEDDFPLDPVDFVTAFEVIEHVHEPLLFLRRIRSLLREGGKMLLTGLTVDGFDIQILWDKSKSVSPPHHINFLSVKGVNFLLERAGFRQIRVFTPGKLDVDIVGNTYRAQPEILDDQRFVRLLLSRGTEVGQAFQRFLAEARLSSHCWIWAEK